MSLFTLSERSVPHRVYQVIGWAIAVAVIIYLPYHSGQAPRINQYSQVAAMAVAILGLNLVIGYSGVIALGHSVFVGIGAYTTVILVAEHDWNYFATLPAAFVICFVVGALFGLPALRIRGFYLAIVTLGLATVFPAFVIRYAAGGANGEEAHDLLVPPSWTPWDAHNRAGPPTYRYFVIVTIAALFFLVARNLVKSRVGRALIAQRDNQTSAATSGVNLPLYRTLIFGVSTGFAGIAGALLMIQRPLATHTQFGLDLAIYLFVGLVVGGVGTISGAVPGAILFVFVPYYALKLSTSFSFLEGRLIAPAGFLYGVLLLLVVFVLPGGAIDGIRRVRSRIVSVRPNPSWLPSDNPAEENKVAGPTENHDEATATPSSPL
jgi:branched-chain amino acid transport system permease protein